MFQTFTARLWQHTHISVLQRNQTSRESFCKTSQMAAEDFWFCDNAEAERGGGGGGGLCVCVCGGEGY